MGISAFWWWWHFPAFTIQSIASGVSKELEKLSNLPCCATRRPQSVESISAGRSTAISCAGVQCHLFPFLPLSLPLLLFSVYFFPVFSVVSFLFFIAPLAVSEEVGAWAPGHGEPSSCMEQGAPLRHFPALPRQVLHLPFRNPCGSSGVQPWGRLESVGHKSPAPLQVGGWGKLVCFHVVPICVL